MNSMTQDEQRAEYVAGLRALANLLEQDPELAVPDTGRSDRPHAQISLCVSDRAQLVAWAKVLTDVTEETTASAQNLHYVRGRLHGLAFRLYGGAEQLGGKARTITKRVTEYTVPPILAAVSE